MNSNCGLDCNFDTNVINILFFTKNSFKHFCNFENVKNNNSENIFKNFSSWKLSNKPVSNPLTGIQQDSKGGIFLNKFLNIFRWNLRVCWQFKK